MMPPHRPRGGACAAVLCLSRHERTMVMARAKDAIRLEPSLYERDFCCGSRSRRGCLQGGPLRRSSTWRIWSRRSRIWALARRRAVRSNLVVVLDAPPEVPVSARPALDGLAVLHRRAPTPSARRSRDQPEPAPLRARAFRGCYQDAVAGADRDRARAGRDAPRSGPGRWSRSSTRTSCPTRRAARPAAAAARSPAARARRRRP